MCSQDNCICYIKENIDSPHAVVHIYLFIYCQVVSVCPLFVVLSYLSFSDLGVQDCAPKLLLTDRCMSLWALVIGTYTRIYLGRNNVAPIIWL